MSSTPWPSFAEETRWTPTLPSREQIVAVLTAYMIAFNYAMTRKGLGGLNLPHSWTQAGFHAACIQLMDPRRIDGKGFASRVQAFWSVEE